MTSNNQSSSSNGPVLQNPLSNAPSTVEWMQHLELGYAEPPRPPTICFGCGKQSSETIKLSRCGKCSVAAYCSRDCQVQDWKTGNHKLACPSYRRALTIRSPYCEDVHATIRNELFARARFYACPYAVFRTTDLGRGFLFLQSDQTLQNMSLYTCKDITGRTITRSVLIHFLTLGEFDSEVCKEDFELALVRTKLKELVDGYDKEKEVVLLFKFRCGHMSLGKAMLVPDYKICKKLGQDYYAENPTGALQLNLDEM
ncbi:MYND finger domain containing protein [Nitzschia inconspicua]|uniref:MYND finger domain containing protein n=1 Tax=Nitzschia inconspicua TaxID=303405 RepID=A0A9K3L060_9STRA|nr:MYND finger domain containing protein [Nitzschia inconspicua]